MAKTADEQIISTLKRGPKAGLTAVDIAERTGLALNTVRLLLSQLSKEGAVKVIGKVETGSRGRPANIYGKVA